MAQRGVLLLRVVVEARVVLRDLPRQPACLLEPPDQGQLLLLVAQRVAPILLLPLIHHDLVHHHRVVVRVRLHRSRESVRNWYGKVW